MTPPAINLPDRLQPIAGWRLAATDLRDLLTLADHHRRRHVLALHDTWGIAAGLRIEHTRPRRFTVLPGVAYDRCGRLMVVASSVLLRDTDDLAEPRVVVLHADVRAREPAAMLRLVAPSALDLGLDVPLGLLTPGELYPDQAVRRHARSAAPMTIAAGHVRHGTAVAAGTPHGWKAWIDTRHAGFRDVPVYVADVTAGAPPSGAGVASVEISDATRDGFNVNVRRAAVSQPALDRTTLTTTPDDVTWIGALAQESADVADPSPPTSPCSGLTPWEDIR